MEPTQFFTASRVLIVAGKGGVGKTTVAATLAVAASRLGISVLLVEIEGKRGLGSVFGEPNLVYHDSILIPGRDSGGGEVRARSISADDALLDYMSDHGLKRLSRTLSRMQVLDTLATSTPGLKDLIVLGKIRQLEQSQVADVVIVDAPASGHAVSFLRSASGLQATVDTGPIRSQADEAVDMLTDPDRCQVILVTLAEETPINELIETAYRLEDEIGVLLAPLVVNGLDADRRWLTGNPAALIGEAGVTLAPSRVDALTAASEYWQQRSTFQHEQLARLTDELPLEQLRLPRRPTPAIGRDDLEVLADVALADIAALRFAG